LSLTLLAFAGLAVLALGGLTTWNLRHGFGEYLAARDVGHLERFADVVARAAIRAGGAPALEQGRLDMRALLDELEPMPADAPGPPGFQGHPPGGPMAFPQRVCVVGLDGQLLLGRPQPPHAGPDVDRPVRINGQVVAWARLMPAPLVRGGVEARFLRDQTLVIALGSAGLIVLALITAAVLARRWVRPLQAVQRATQRLARGEFGVRLQPGPDFAPRSDEIGDVVHNINRMAEGLQQLEGARRRWLADISHELRTPLTVLRGDIEALHDGVRPLQPPAIAALRDEVLHLGKLVDDLHLLATSDLQTLPCRFEATDARQIVQQAVQRFETRAQAAGLALALRLAGDAAVPVCWDAARVAQLLANLLENSLRYTDAPGQIVVSLAQHGAQVVISVDDSAPGVAPADLPQLLEPLFRAEASRSRERGGSGLGLAICQAIALAHGGQVQAATSALGGLCLTLILPAQANASP
jgi:two-component system sensor histidine kinase BaeS